MITMNAADVVILNAGQHPATAAARNVAAGASRRRLGNSALGRLAGWRPNRCAHAVGKRTGMVYSARSILEERRE
jgi:hypothetical protein